jgi:hypothetical protein
MRGGLKLGRKKINNKGEEQEGREMEIRDK